ncbi:hypothetical protein ILUMI_14774 [Ignelater luminosus]|uniref:Uncharacterized protein n=1 Tax=Ignelater luminosus TaxID=2038154 RepID=A0A8K0CPV6_IGNLU|nr:hypothetical protein ILUMI_14774 [Ignelater luminosus]
MEDYIEKNYIPGEIQTKENEGYASFNRRTYYWCSNAKIRSEAYRSRELALRPILKCQDLHPVKTGIPEFKVPNFNFEAEEYIDMIDW